MIILDTNVLSELMRPKPAPNVHAWTAKQFRTELFTTSISEAEIFYGIELLSPGRRRDELMRAAEAVFTNEFAGRVIGFESDAARDLSKILARRRALGRPIGYADAQIAAITRVRKAVLATRNIADFQDSGVEVVNPWHSS
jgi:toxin FitB